MASEVCIVGTFLECYLELKKIVSTEFEMTVNNVNYQSSNGYFSETIVVKLTNCSHHLAIQS